MNAVPIVMNIPPRAPSGEVITTPGDDLATLVISLIILVPFIAGLLVWLLATLNWPGFGRLGCRWGRHKLPTTLTFLPGKLPDGREFVMVVGECPRCHAKISRSSEGEWLEVQ